MRAVDLFAGAGGTSTGARSVGVEIVAAVNHWRRAVEAHALNHPGAQHLCEDAAILDPTTLPAHDLLLASPSCTGHTRARGVDRPHHDAARATAWCVLRVAEAQRPRAVIVENSQRNDPSPLEEAESIDLLTRKHGRTVDQVADKLGRDVRWVRRRLTLLTLCEAARERMRKGELPLAHAERVTDLVCPREFGPEASHG